MPGLATSDDLVLLVAAAFSLMLLAVGAVERVRHRRALRAVPLRISVNGSRGKSTVARLAVGALAAGRRRPLGKTTGTEARLIHGWSGEEETVVRRPEGPNIGEQRGVMRRAAALGADTVVAECMAVTPEYQATFHAELLDANVLLVTNVLADHLEDMGPTLDDVAEVFAESIPRDGVVVVTRGPQLATFERWAHARGATLVVADPDDVTTEVTSELLDRFEHLVFPEHVALVLALARHLGIPRAMALRGMLAAPPDPYATRLLAVGDPARPELFVNAFPANDPASTRGIWALLEQRGHSADTLAVVMNCRGDRVERTRQFAAEVLPALPAADLVVVGEAVQPVLRAARRGHLPARRVHDRSGADPDAVVDDLLGGPDGRVVLGVGNLHGAGVGIVEAFERRSVDPARQPGAA